MNRFELPTGSPGTPTPFGRLILLLILLLLAYASKTVAYTLPESSYSGASGGISSDSIPCLHDRTIQAVIDSALMYEAIKPVTRQLRIITSLQNQENENLKRQMSLQDLQMQKERKETEATIRKARREAFWRGFWRGGVAVGVAWAIITAT